MGNKVLTSVLDRTAGWRSSFAASFLLFESGVEGIGKGISRRWRLLRPEILENRFLLSAPPTGESYFIFEDWSSGNSWCDAEKSPSDSDDNLMCWAAAASNILAWGGWGVGEIDTCDEIFAHFQDNWTDSISVPSAGWEWWFQGTDLAAMNGDGGAYFTEYVYDDWMYGGSSGTQTISDIHYLMQAGYGVTLGLSGPGGHAVTCWGLNYNPDTGEYLGLWISDSDDMKGTDTPEDQLRYYEVRTENNRYYLNNYCSSNSWYISYSSGLMARPEIITPVPAGTVVGTLFNDLNGDGDQDPGEEGLADQSVFLDQNGNGTQENRNAVFTNDTPTTLLDVAYVTSTINVDSAITSITDLNLTLDISHTKNRMVSAWLISPDGTRTTLFSNIGGSGDNFENVTFDDEAAETARAVPDGTITGTLQPFYCLSQFDGMNPNGEWTLELYGRWPGYTGTLNSWSLDITESEQLAATDAEGNFAFTTHPNGDYSVLILDEGCIRSPDLNSDGVVDSDDLSLLRSAWEQQTLEYDITGDGRINGADLNRIRLFWRAVVNDFPKFLDFSGDGKINSDDLSMLRDSWGTAASAYDVTGDGRVGAADLDLIRAFWGRVSPALLDQMGLRNPGNSPL